jgi:hypothetical protein
LALPNAEAGTTLSATTVRPNPVNDIATIEIPSGYAGTTILEVYDAIGKLHASKSVSDVLTTEINLNELPAGIYLLVIRQGENICSIRLQKN